MYAMRQVFERDRCEAGRCEVCRGTGDVREERREQMLVFFCPYLLLAAERDLRCGEVDKEAEEE